jgi:GNAT superfamily N-acetyltransferase
MIEVLKEDVGSDSGALNERQLCGSESGAGRQTRRPRLWAAIDVERQREGFGTRLIEQTLMTLRSEGVLLVEVKTLDGSANYEPYEATLAFWEGRGFIKIDVIDPFPGWQPGNPCAIYVTVLPGYLGP